MTVEENRAAAIYALRYNPKGFTQCQLVMNNGEGGRCALGVMADALGIDVQDSYSNLGDDPYDELEELLNIDSMKIYRLNDTSHMTFAEIADELENNWSKYEPNWP
jgi:hypothetical protein